MAKYVFPVDDVYPDEKHGTYYRYPNDEIEKEDDEDWDEYLTNEIIVQQCSTAVLGVSSAKQWTRQDIKKGEHIMYYEDDEEEDERGNCPTCSGIGSSGTGGQCEDCGGTGDKDEDVIYHDN